MIAVQTPEVPTTTDTFAQICEQYDVAKLVKTTIPGNYVVYYRQDRPGTRDVQIHPVGTSHRGHHRQADRTQ